MKNIRRFFRQFFCMHLSTKFSTMYINSPFVDVNGKSGVYHLGVFECSKCGKKHVKVLK